MEILIITNTKGESITFSRKSRFILSQIEGLGDVDAKNQMQDTPHMDGSTYINSFLQSRHLDVSFSIWGSDDTDISDKRAELARIASPKNGLLRIQYQTGRNIREISGVADSVPKYAAGRENRSHLYQFGMLSITCPDPYWRSQTRKFTMRAFDEAFTMPFSFPIEYGMQGQLVTIKNKGHEASLPRIEIEGPVDRPTIENLTTGDRITMNRAIQQGETLVIDNQNRSIRILTEAGSINASRWKTLDSKWLTIEFGENEIQYTAVAGSSKGVATVFYYDRFIGI